MKTRTISKGIMLNKIYLVYPVFHFISPGTSLMDLVLAFLGIIYLYTYTHRVNKPIKKKETYFNLHLIIKELICRWATIIINT